MFVNPLRSFSLTSLEAAWEFKHPPPKKEKLPLDPGIELSENLHSAPR